MAWAGRYRLKVSATAQGSPFALQAPEPAPERPDQPLLQQLRGQPCCVPAVRRQLPQPRQPLRHQLGGGDRRHVLRGHHLHLGQQPAAGSGQHGGPGARVGGPPGRQIRGRGQRGARHLA